jgi:hypothetical protein
MVSWCTIDVTVTMTRPGGDRESAGSMLVLCVRSMRGGFIFRSRGPLQKVCHGPARMSGHNCLPGPQTVCFPGGRPHEQNDRFHGWMAVQVKPTQSEPPTSFPSRLDYYSCVRRLCVRPPRAKHWAPVGAPSHRWRGFPLVVSTHRPWERPARDTCKPPITS